MLRHFAVAGVMFVAALAAASHACAADEAVFQPAFQQFNRAQAGDTGAIDAAADAFEAMSRAEPENPLLMAYAGASVAMKARATSLPWKKMGYAEDGLARIDKALALLGPAHEPPMQHGTPGNLETRFIAANTFLAMPGFMNRGDRGAQLLDAVLAAPNFDRAPLPFRGQVWMRAAALAKAQQRPADARRHLEAVISHAAPQAEAARAQLKEPA